jgi:hypothetical protein
MDSPAPVGNVSRLLPTSAAQKRRWQAAKSGIERLLDGEIGRLCAFQYFVGLVGADNERLRCQRDTVGTGCGLAIPNIEHGAV